MRFLPTLFLGLLALPLPATALALMPPQAYTEARQTANHHVQIEVIASEVPQITPGRCSVFGRVITVFRSQDAVLHTGSLISFAVDCLRAQDEPTMPGPILWGDADELGRAKFIEAYLDGNEPPSMKVARWQYAIIPAPSVEPVCPPEASGFSCR